MVRSVKIYRLLWQAVDAADISEKHETKSLLFNCFVNSVVYRNLFDLHLSESPGDQGHFPCDILTRSEYRGIYALQKNSTNLDRCCVALRKPRNGPTSSCGCKYEKEDNNRIIQHSANRGITCNSLLHLIRFMLIRWEQIIHMYIQM